MATQDKFWQRLLFWAAFLVLTLFVWSPLGYGRYGESGRMFAIPAWAVTALGLGALLFVLEWLYLFKTDLALDDDDLPDIMRELEVLESNKTKSAREEK